MDSWPTKDPDEVLDYQLDWSERLEDGETIVSSEFIPASGDVVLDSDDVTGLITTVWISGGTAGTFNVLTNRVVTSEGRTYDWSMRLRVRER